MRLGHGFGSLAIVLAVVWGIGGCSTPPTAEVAAKTTPAANPAPKTAETPASAPTPEPAVATPASLPRVSDRPANPDGRVFVVEYHHVSEGKGDMFRSPAEFRRDLERLHKLGFRPCTVSDYLENKFPMGSGATPAVFTFDDSNPSQFQLREDGTVDPNCAVGIWMDFAKTHPDFPVRATFYVLPDVMWAQPKWVKKKVEMLREMGSELGSHTVSHPILKRLSDEKVKEEFAGAIDRLEEFGTPSPVSLALPFGVSPKNKALLKEFNHKGKTYRMKAAFLVGANPAPPVTDPKFDAYRIPRIQCYNGPFGIEHWFKELDKGNVKLYVTR